MLTREEIFGGGIETKTVEFKRILTDGAEAYNWLKTVCAFANTLGGKIYVGVDNDGSDIGLPRDKVDSQVQLFIRNVKEHIHPAPLYNFVYRDTEGGGIVIVIEIKKGIHPPYVLVFHSIPSIYIRDEGCNAPVYGDDLYNLILSATPHAQDKVLTDEVFHIDDFTVLSTELKQQKGLNLRLPMLVKREAATADGHLRMAALMLRDDYNGPFTTYRVIKWHGNIKGDDTYIELTSGSGNVIEAVSDIVDTILSNTEKIEIKKDIGRTTVPAYPVRSLTEAVINAFVHRNLNIKNSQILVNIFRDRNEISSPGSLGGGIAFEKERNLGLIDSEPQNLLLGSLLNMVNMYEGLGTGLKKILADYSSADESHQPYVSSHCNAFTLTLPSLLYGPGLKHGKSGLALIGIDEDDITDKQKKILDYCYNGKRTAEEIATMLRIKPSTYLRDEIIKPLLVKGLLFKTGQSKQKFYGINKERVHRVYK